MATEQIEEVLTGDPKPKPGLADEHRSKLDSIVQQMIKNKESDGTIQMVVNDFKQKYSTVQPEQKPQQPIQQSPPAEAPAFKPMTDWLNMPQAAQPLVKDNVVNEHTAKTSEASERVKAHLNDIDNSVRNLLHEHKKDLLGRLTSQNLAANPKEAGPINFQAQQLQQKDKQDVYVSPVEIESFKSEMPNNHVLLRRALDQKAKDLTKTNPAEANSLKADIYRLDRQNNPEKESKISNNIKKINEGEYDYDIVDVALTKPVGFFGGLVEGFKEKNKTFEEFDVYDTGNESDIIKYLNKKITHDADEPTVVGGEAGMMIGGQPLKPIAGGLLAGAAAGPAAGTAAMAMITGPEMYKLGYANALPQNYAAIKKENPGISDIDAYHKASELADKQASVDAATGMAMGLVGGKLAFKPTGLNAGLLQKSLGSALLQIGEATTKKTLEGLGVGTIGASGQVVKNIMAQKAGLPIDTDMGIKEQLIGGVGMTMGMAMIAKFPEVLKPKTYNQILQAFKGVPKETIESTLGDLEKAGEVTPEQSLAAQKTIQEHQAIDNSIKPNVPEADRLKVQELIKKRNELEASLETEDKAYHADTKEKIKALNDQINNVSKGEERGDLQKLVDKEHKDGNLEGFVTETLRNASENDLNKYFKEIAEQAHDPNSEATTIATFGENIVNKAKELYPKEEPKASSISVIQPGEIKHPETITIKPEEKLSNLSEGAKQTVGATTDLKKFNQAGRELGLDKPQRGDYEEGIAGDNKYAEDNDRHNQKVDGLIGSIKEEGTLVDNQGTEYDVEITSQGVRVSPKNQNDYKLYYKGKRVTAETPFTNGFTFKPKENAIQVRSAEEIPVGETPGHSQPMGEGIPQSGETTGTQEGGPATPKEENPNKGQKGKVGEPEMVGITHAEMDKVSRELGLPEYTQDPETFEGWTREAKDRIAKDPDSINKLINKLRKGESPDPVETQMMKLHFAALKEKYNNNPTPELLAEINRTKDLYNISGRALGKGLVARKGLVPEEDTLADFHMRDVEFNKGAPLTEEQTAQSTKEFQEIKAAKDALEAKVAKMEADRIKEKAEKKVQQEAKIAKKDNKRDYKSERDKIFSDIKDKLRKARGETNIVGVPYAKELIAIAPDVIKLVANVIGEGVEKLPDIIKAVHGQIKELIPEITEKDVHDIIAGEYNQKKQTRNAIQEKLFDLRLQAKLINKLEALESGMQPKNEKQRRVRNQEIVELRQKIKELEGTEGRTDAEKLASLKGRYKNKIAELENKIRNGDFGPDEKPEPIVLDKEGKELKDRYIEVKKERELRLAKQEYENRPLGQRLGDLALGVLDLRRMVGTAFDFSVPFRQALPITINPLKIKTTALAFKKMFSHFYSAKNLDRWWFDLENSADYKEMLDDGVPIHSPDDLRISKREEEFRTKLAEQIPIVGPGVKASNRAASGYLNSMRVDLYRKGRAVLEAKGMTRENSPEVYKSLGNDIANLTGSGKLLSWLEGKPATALGGIFFGARLMAAKFNLLNPITYAKMPKPLMKMALRDLAIRTGMYVTAGYLAKAAGLGVTLDPNDKDFMKIKHGETSYDITGGEAIYVRTFLRVLAAAKERISGEEESSIKTAEKAGKSVTSFFRNKLAPTPSYVIDAYLGKKSYGADFDPYDIVRVYPMWIDDIVDDWHQDKAKSILTTAIPSIFGIGVMTIPPKEGGESGGAGASSSFGKPAKPTKPSKPHKTHR